MKRSELKQIIREVIEENTNLIDIHEKMNEYYSIIIDCFPDNKNVFSKNIQIIDDPESKTITKFSEEVHPINIVPGVNPYINKNFIISLCAIPANFAKTIDGDTRAMGVTIFRHNAKENVAYPAGVSLLTKYKKNDPDLEWYDLVSNLAHEMIHCYLSYKLNFDKDLIELEIKNNKSHNDQFKKFANKISNVIGIDVASH